MSSAVHQLISMLPEDQHAGAYQALNAEFALRLEEHLAAQQQASMASLSSSSSIPTIAPVALTQPPQATTVITGTSSTSSSYVKPQAPEAFNGTRTKVDQFLIQLRRYLVLANLTTNISDQRQVEYAAQFLTGEALVWFENVQKSGVPIVSFLEFETKVRAHFIPYGTEKIARTKLRQLQQTGSVQAYSTLFMQTVTHCRDMHVADQVEQYVAGLKGNVYREVVLKDLRTLQEVMDYAVFVEARFQHHRDGGFRSFRDRFTPSSGPRHSGSGTAVTASSSSVPMDLSAIEDHHEVDLNAMNGQVLKKLTDAERDQLRRQGKCFRCRQSGHISRDCPKGSKNGLAQH
jgi:hypothetical protein